MKVLYRNKVTHKSNKDKKVRMMLTLPWDDSIRSFDGSVDGFELASAIGPGSKVSNDDDSRWE